jgi:hypothetical protein
MSFGARREYNRHGTLSWFLNLDVVSGQVIEPSWGPTRTEEDCLAHLKRGNFLSLDDLRTQILAFITYSNRTMAKPIKWTYTGLTSSEKAVLLSLAVPCWFSYQDDTALLSRKR